MTETEEPTFREAVDLVGAMPREDERNDLIFHGKLWPGLWRWSSYKKMSREHAIALHKRVDHEYLVVLQPQPPKPTFKRPPLPEQRSARRKPSSGGQPMPTPTQDPA